MLKAGINRLLELNRHYDGGKMEETRELIGSIYPDNLIFENNQLRIGRVNEGVRLIYMINMEIDGYKKRTKKKNTSLSLWWAMRGSNLNSKPLSFLCFQNFEKHYCHEIATNQLEFI